MSQTNRQDERRDMGAHLLSLKETASGEVLSTKYVTDGLPPALPKVERPVSIQVDPVAQNRDGNAGLTPQPVADPHCHIRIIARLATPLVSELRQAQINQTTFT
jgi:hypothetical protein